MNPFSRASLKVNRAKHNIQDLNAQAQAFSESNPYALTFEKNVESPNQLSPMLHVGQGVVSKLDNLSLITGDAVHNLRSALDLLAVELVEAARDFLASGTRLVPPG